MLSFRFPVFSYWNHSYSGLPQIVDSSLVNIHYFKFRKWKRFYTSMFRNCLNCTYFIYFDLLKRFANTTPAFQIPPSTTVAYVSSSNPPPLQKLFWNFVNPPPPQKKKKNIYVRGHYLTYKNSQSNPFLSFPLIADELLINEHTLCRYGNFWFVKAWCSLTCLNACLPFTYFAGEYLTRCFGRQQEHKSLIPINMVSIFHEPKKSYFGFKTRSSTYFCAWPKRSYETAPEIWEGKNHFKLSNFQIRKNVCSEKYLPIDYKFQNSKQITWNTFKVAISNGIFSDTIFKSTSSVIYCF